MPEDIAITLSKSDVDPAEIHTAKKMQMDRQTYKHKFAYNKCPQALLTYRQSTKEMLAGDQVYPIDIVMYWLQ